MSKVRFLSLRFYTLPPTRIEWPWIIVSLNRLFSEWKKENFKKSQHIIVDSGVDKWFFIEKLKEYPDSYNTFAPYQFQSIQQKLGDRVRITIPDYPDDYTPRQTFQDGKDNVDKTVEAIRRYTAMFPDVNWMPVAQARYLDVDSFVAHLPEIGRAVEKYGWVGLGTVCKTHDVAFIEKCCKALAREYPDANKHAFGATSESYPIIRHYVQSFDSTAYSWYTQRHKKEKMMVRNQLEREQAFVSWTLMMKEKVDAPMLETMEDARSRSE